MSPDDKPKAPPAAIDDAERCRLYSRILELAVSLIQVDHPDARKMESRALALCGRGWEMFDDPEVGMRWWQVGRHQTLMNAVSDAFVNRSRRPRSIILGRPL